VNQHRHQVSSIKYQVSSNQHPASSIHQPVTILPMIWNEKAECASRSEMDAIQSERLKLTIARIYNN